MTEQQKNSAADEQDAPVIAHGRDLDLPLIATIGVAGTFVVAVIIILAQAGFTMSVNEELREKSLAQSSQELADLRLVQQKKIETYRTIDSAKGVVAIPVQRAMDLVVAERKRTAVVR